MTLYYFHFQSGSKVVLDEEGVRLASRADALERATRLATHLLEEGSLACDWRRSSIRVEDAQQRAILRRPMASIRARDRRQRHIRAQ